MLVLTVSDAEAVAVADVFADESLLLQDLIPSQDGVRSGGGGEDKGITGLGAVVDEDPPALPPTAQDLLLDRGLEVHELRDLRDLRSKGLFEEGDQLPPSFQDQGIRLIHSNDSSCRCAGRGSSRSFLLLT